jgi:hypothetical protein
VKQEFSMKRTCLFALAVLTLAPCSASAAVFQVIVTGVLAPGANDISNYLGQGNDLSGKQVEMTYTFDTAPGYYYGAFHPFGNANWFEIVDQGANPANTLVIKIGSATLSPKTGPFSYERIDKETYYTYGPASGYIQSQFTTFLPDGVRLGAQFFYAFSGARLFQSADFLSPFSVSGDSPYTAGEPIEAFFGGGTNSNDDGSQSIAFGGDLIPSTLRIRSSAVPEPATWAMMLIGIGAVGLAARRRKPLRTVRPE